MPLYCERTGAPSVNGGTCDCPKCRANNQTMGSPSIVSSDPHTHSFQIREMPEAFPRLPALAKRLGVDPNTRPGEPGRTLLQMKNGDVYDLFDLVNAFLDRLDANDTPRS